MIRFWVRLKAQRLPGGSDVGVQEERSSGNSKGFSLSKWKDGTAIFQEGKGISSVGNTCHGKSPLRSLKQKGPISTQKI